MWDWGGGSGKGERGSGMAVDGKVAGTLGRLDDGKPSLPYALWRLWVLCRRSLVYSPCSFPAFSLLNPSNPSY
jgi:hypothetical protein